MNNAGIGIGDTDLRGVLGVNTFGVRRVCEAFVGLLRASGGRVVNITSASGPSYVSTCSEERQRFFLDANANWPALERFLNECMAIEGPEAFAAKGLGTGDPYGLSKACTNTYTLILASDHPELRVNACTPGFIATDLTRPYADAAGKSPEAMGMKAPSEGTRSTMFLLFGEPQGNGRYYGSDAVRSPLDRYRGPGTPAYTDE